MGVDCGEKRGPLLGVRFALKKGVIKQADAISRHMGAPPLPGAVLIYILHIVKIVASSDVNITIKIRKIGQTSIRHVLYVLRRITVIH